MATVPNVPAPRNPVAFRAWLRDVPGVALRTPDRRVHFADDATQTWRELTDADAPVLTLCGRIDVFEAQWLADGPVYAWVERRNTEHARVAA
jgi:hypothetical protein